MGVQNDARVHGLQCHVAKMTLVFTGRVGHHCIQHGREHGCHFWHPWTRPVKWTRPVNSVCTELKSSIAESDNIARQLRYVYRQTGNNTSPI